MQLSDVLAEIESRYPCISGIYAPVAQTGCQYVKIGEEKRTNHPDDALSTEVLVPGVVREGIPRVLYETEDEACRAFLVAFKAYALWWHRENGSIMHLGREKPKSLRPLTLYWRYAAPHLFLETAFDNVGKHKDFVTGQTGVGRYYSEQPTQNTKQTVRYVRSRLVLSDKPVVWADLDAYHAANTPETSTSQGSQPCRSPASPAAVP